MQIFRELAGYSLGRADLVRRAMSKKKHDVMQRERDIFINGLVEEDGTVTVEGCVRRGVPVAVAEAVFEEMASFASYAFNKAHAAAYALVAYRTAYLKCHYPKEYMAALLTSVMDSDKIARYIRECERMGIRVLPPSVNESEENFTVAGDHIRFGLLAVKNLGRGMIAQLCREREENGPYTGFYNFCERLSRSRDFNRRALESLVRCGALDNLGSNRNQMLTALEPIVRQLEDYNRHNVEGQLGFFDTPELASGEDAAIGLIPALPELPYNELLAMEKEATGLYLSGHPLAPYADLYRAVQAVPIEELMSRFEEHDRRFGDGARVTLLVTLTRIRTKTTRQNTTMAYAVAEDLAGSMELVLFPRVFAQFGNLITEGTPLLITGHISVRDEEPPQLAVERIAAAPSPEQAVQRKAAVPPASTTPSVPSEPPARTAASTQREGQRNTPSATPSARHGLYLRVASASDTRWKQAQATLAVFDGNEPLYVRFADTGKLMKAPADRFVDLNEVLIGELKRLLGEENVAIVQ